MAACVLQPIAVARVPTSAKVAVMRPACVGFQRQNYGALVLQTARTCVRMRASGPSVLDAPTTTSHPEQGTERVYKRPPIYKVFLHNDSYNKREYVVKVLLKVVSEINMDDAVTVMQEAHETGVALVVACPQDNAELYCEGLRLNGLTSTIEPGGC